MNIDRRCTPAQLSLFDEAVAASRVALPEGLIYEPDFLSPDEEAELIGLIRKLPLQEMRYKEYTAKRRVVYYGGSYDFDARLLQPASELTPELEPLRRRVAAWLGVAPQAFTQTLVAEYRTGTPLGWHRDVPDFEDIVGVSLLGTATMRFRPYPPDQPKKADIVKLRLEPRSIYLLRGPARWRWQHSVAATESLRYSITFRTSVAKPAGHR